MIALSVILPTHNPRPEYLRRTVAALCAQSLPTDQWELVVVDNRSDVQVAKMPGLGWPGNTRIVREETLGLTAARLRGFREAAADSLVLVDDDNVLAPDYLETALHLFRTKSFLGVFGGSLAPEFESPPPEWTRPHWGALAIRPVQRSIWSNDIEHYEATPVGAGMCLRREVGVRYAEEMATHPLRRALDRTGACLASGGDTDLVFTCLSMGLGMGRFRELAITHLIPPQRLSAEYFERLYESTGYAEHLLNNIWNRTSSGTAARGLTRLIKLGVHAFIRDMGGRRFLRAQRRGALRAKTDTERLRTTTDDRRHSPELGG